jgi:hypothetical protein
VHMASGLLYLLMKSGKPSRTFGDTGPSSAWAYQTA